MDDLTAKLKEAGLVGTFGLSLILNPALCCALINPNSQPCNGNPIFTPTPTPKPTKPTPTRLRPTPTPTPKR